MLASRPVRPLLANHSRALSTSSSICEQFLSTTRILLPGRALYSRPDRSALSNQARFLSHFPSPHTLPTADLL